MRRVVLGALAAALVVIAGCAAPQKTQPWIVGMECDWNAFSLPDQRAAAWKRMGVTDVFAAAGVIRYGPSSTPTSTAASFRWEHVAAGLPVTLVLDLEGPGLDKALEEDWTLVARVLSQESQTAIERAGKAGVKPKGVQIRIKEAVYSAGPLAEALKRWRKTQRSETTVSASVPPKLLFSSAARQLVRSVEMLVVDCASMPPAGDAEGALKALPSPSTLERTGGRLQELKAAAAIALPAQPVCYVIEPGQHEAAASKLSPQLLRPGNRPTAWPGIALSRVAEGAEYLRASSRALLVAPHQPGLARLLKHVPAEGSRYVRGVIIQAARDTSAPLAMGDEEIEAALKQEECLPQPQITMRPADEAKDRLIIRVSNVGCGRPAFAPKSVRLRVSYPSGTVRYANQGQFDRAEVFRSSEGSLVPAGPASSDTLIFTGHHLIGHTLEAGPIRIVERKGDKLKLTATFLSPAGLPDRAADMEVVIR